jgi:hypothetical protein
MADKEVHLRKEPRQSGMNWILPLVLIAGVVILLFALHPWSTRIVEPQGDASTTSVPSQVNPSVNSPSQQGNPMRPSTGP